MGSPVLVPSVGSTEQEVKWRSPQWDTDSKKNLGKVLTIFLLKKKKKVLVIDAYSVHHPGDCSPQECEMPTFLS